MTCETIKGWDDGENQEREAGTEKGKEGQEKEEGRRRGRRGDAGRQRQR